MIVFKRGEIQDTVDELAIRLEYVALDRSGQWVRIAIDRDRLLADIIASVGRQVDGVPGYLATDQQAFPVLAFHPDEVR